MTVVRNANCLFEYSNDGVTSGRNTHEPPTGITREGFVRSSVKSRSV